MRFLSLASAGSPGPWQEAMGSAHVGGGAGAGAGRGGELRRDERPLGTQGGTGQGHGSQRWLTGQGAGSVV